MRSRKVTRWYCDFCKASRFQQPAMLRHETMCTANPNRECQICTGEPQTGAADLVDLVAFCRKNANSEKVLGTEHVAELRKLADGCPACMTAAIRQAPVFAMEWDCKKEFVDFWTTWKRSEAAEFAAIVGPVS